MPTFECIIIQFRSLIIVRGGLGDKNSPGKSQFQRPSVYQRPNIYFFWKYNLTLHFLIEVLINLQKKKTKYNIVYYTILEL